MKKCISLIIFTFIIFTTNAQVKTVFWRVDNLTQIGGNNFTILGNPRVIPTEIGPSIEFDGIKDGLIFNTNPMNGATTAFTVEIIIKPYTGGAVEQRYLHFEQDTNNRILTELRNPSNLNWSLDTFIKSGISNQTLLDYNLVHSLDKWFHVALVYKDGAMTNYVNGIKELVGSVVYQPVSSGQTSIGVRLNKVSWFKGAIHSVKVTHTALNPIEFMKVSSFLGFTKIAKNELVSEISPNPIVSSAILKYELEAPTNVSINLYNIQGKIVANFYEGHQNSGSHELQINRNNFESGLYLLAVNTEEKSWVQKIIISD